MWWSGPPIEPPRPHGVPYDGVPREPPPHRALLIAITYEGIEGYRLQAPRIDLDYMYDLALQFGYQPSQIRVLTDISWWRDGSARPAESVWAPNHQNIVHGCRWLVNGARESSSLFFYFSGHGMQMPDFQGTERDGQNECLLPVDVHNPIVDDELRRELVHPLNPNARLSCVVDSCHSGNCLDLPFTVGQVPSPWWPGQLIQDSDPLYGVGTVNLLSSSEDSQRAAGNANRGSIFTTSFCKVLRTYSESPDARHPTFREFLAAIRYEIRQQWGIEQVPHFSTTQHDMLDRSLVNSPYRHLLLPLPSPHLPLVHSEFFWTVQ